MKIYFIAGESSGDFIGARVIKSIKELNNEAIFSGIGGTLMNAEGVRSLFDFQQISLMGFVEILPHIFKLKKLINLTIEDVINNKTDILVTIDSPGFTYRVAEKIKIKAPHIKLIHIVAPSVWAYKPGRALKYAKVYDKLLTLLPFEPSYFTKHGLNAEFIGHPILEQEFYNNAKIKRDRKIIAITPGSRKGEIGRHLPIIRPALEELAKSHDFEVIFVQSNNNLIPYIEDYLQGAKFNFSFSNDKLKVFGLCNVALAKSGTNTLEIAASGASMIVAYKLNSLTYMLLKMMIKVKYASIINIIPNQEIIPEYIQENFTVKNIVNGLNELLTDSKKANKQVKEAAKILKMLKIKNVFPSKRAAQIILAMI